MEITIPETIASWLKLFPNSELAIDAEAVYLNFAYCFVRVDRGKDLEVTLIEGLKHYVDCVRSSKNEELRNMNIPEEPLDKLFNKEQFDFLCSLGVITLSKEYVIAPYTEN